MRRRIIKQGNNSYTLTLPVSWIREEKLERGGEVEIEQEDSNLIVSIPKDVKREERAFKIDIKNYNERTIRNILNQTYRKGYDKIEIAFTTKEQLEIIRDITRNTLLGFEVVEENSNTCTIQNIAEPTDERFSAILRKIFFYILDESKEILEEFKNKKLTNLKKRQHNKDIVDNYTNLCRRLVIKYKVGGSVNSYLLMEIVSRLSLIYHAYFYMYKFTASQKNLQIKKEILNLLQEVNNMFNILYESFYFRDLDKAHEVGILKDKLLFGTIYNLLQKSKGAENVILYYIGEIIRLTHMESTNVFGLTDLQLY